jgi:hypothetical protein
MVHKIYPDQDVIKLLKAIVKNHSVLTTPYKKITKEEFLNVKLPTNDVENDFQIKWNLSNYNRKYLIAAGSLLKAKRITNAIIYPPYSMMGWHTNSNYEGIRTYYTYTEDEAVFRYVDSNGDMQLDYDNIGWTRRTFKIQKKNPLWHSIWAKSNRYSFGFMTDDIN